jgi:hypothetical protein
MGLVLLAVWAGMACAYPTFTGPTGLVALPSAEMGAPGLVVAADQQAIEGGHSRPLRGTLALGNLLEAGAAVNGFNGDVHFDTAWALHGKLAVGRAATGTMAIGAQYLSQQGDLVPDQKAWQGYLAWSSDFAPEVVDASGINLTVGANWTRIRPTGSADLDAVRAYAGLEMRMLKSLVIATEYQTKSPTLGDAEPVTSVAARITVNPLVSLQIGSTNALGFSALPQHTFFFGAALQVAGPAK